MPDHALQELDKLIGNLDRYLENHYNEADTRVKFIDPLLTDVLRWNEHLHIRREENYTNSEERRCVDYVLSLQHPVLVVEAKKSLRKFEIPTKLNKIDYSLCGVIRQWKNAWDTILQAQRYCVDIGSRYALITNGHQYIAFKAVSESPSWSQGHALVFASPQVLRNNFTLFYECLSREAIAQDKLSDFAFPRERPAAKEKARTRIQVSNYGFRNQLYAVIDSAFRDVLLDVPQGDPSFLRDCYCSSADAMRYTGHLNSAVVDPLPAFRAPIERVRPGHRKDAFDQALEEAGNTQAGAPLFVVMGGVGVGKTSFLRWYFESQMPKEAKTHSVVVFCDYRTIESTVEELHDRTLRIVIDDIISQTEKQTTAFPQLCEMFRTRLDRARGILKPYLNDPQERDKQIAGLLRDYQDYSPQHLDALVNFIRARMNSRVIVVLDNMDQKAPELQDRLYQIANEFIYRCHLVVVISLREATFRRIAKTATGDAFASREFHVKAQPIDLILSKRLSFVQTRLSSQKVRIKTETGTIDVVDIHRFISLMQRSLLSSTSDPRIIECISTLSNSNVREQLRMVYSFLVSGQTKIDDYFWRYAINDQAKIPFHEFLHSMLYQDQRFFDEGIGEQFLNIFEPAPGTHTSHFTALRILLFLHVGLAQTGDLRSTDFIGVDVLFDEFGDYGWSRDEIAFHFQRFARFGLLMPESGSTGDALLPQPCALTRCGLYYLKSLHSEFTYFSAMAADTSIADHSLVDEIATMLRANLAGPKIPLAVRRKMAERFLGYLDSTERAEQGGAIRRHPVVGRAVFAPGMIATLHAIPQV